MSHQTIKHFDRKGNPQGLNINPATGDVGVVLYDQWGNPLLTHDQKQIVLPELDYFIHLGQVKYIQNYRRIEGAGTKTYIYARVPQMSNPWPDEYMDIHMHWKLGAEAEFEIASYFLPTVATFGTRLEPRNRNARYAGTYDALDAWIDNTFSSLGIWVWSDVIGAGRSNEAGDQSLGETILTEGTTFVLEFTKVPSGTHWLSWNFVFSEEYVGTPLPFDTPTTSTTTTTTTT